MAQNDAEQVTMEQVEAVSSRSAGRKRAALWVDDETGSIIASSEVAARYFGVSQQALSNWVAAGCPKYRYGYYDIKAVSDYRNRAQGLAPSPDEPTDPDAMSVQQQKLYYEQRLKAAQAESAELRNEAARGGYLDRQQAIADMKKFCVVLKRSLMGLGRKLSREVAEQIGPTEARKFDSTVMDTINDALDQMSVEGVYRYGGK